MSSILSGRIRPELAYMLLDRRGFLKQSVCRQRQQRNIASRIVSYKDRLTRAINTNIARVCAMGKIATSCLFKQTCLFINCIGGSRSSGLPVRVRGFTYCIQ
ncbi:hypothetical protein D3C78_1361630 [compost metagenome]